ncbi:hypothetical protein R3J21_22775, partial [Citrobacter werkmanii]|uniref:hypothetical protein n=1 Tax=Citrobacter werkmanii TaxID=67827 RepID=UPI00295515B5
LYSIPGVCLLKLAANCEIEFACGVGERWWVRNRVKRSAGSYQKLQKQKPALWAGSLNSGAGLGIDLLFYFYDL